MYVCVLTFTKSKNTYVSHKKQAQVLKNSNSLAGETENPFASTQSDMSVIQKRVESALQPAREADIVQGGQEGGEGMGRLRGEQWRGGGGGRSP